MLALQLSLQLMILIAVGYFVCRLNIVDENFDKSLTSFLLNIALPCMIIQSFNAPFSPDELRNCLILLLISICYITLCFGIGQFAFILSARNHTGRMLRFGALFVNFSFFGIPVAEVLYGQTGVLYFVVFIVPFRIAFYSLAKPLLSPPGTVHAKKTVLGHIKGWLSPPIIAVFVGLILYVTGLRPPGPIEKTLAGIGAITSPMGMILCGMTIGKNDIRAMLSPKYLLMPLLRNILIPALTLAIMYFLPVNPLVAKIVVIYAALPVASLLAAFTIQYEPDPAAQLESAGSVFFSILACAVTIPLWAQLAEYVL